MCNEIFVNLNAFKLLPSFMDLLLKFIAAIIRFRSPTLSPSIHTRSWVFNMYASLILSAESELSYSDLFILLRRVDLLLCLQMLMTQLTALRDTN